MSGESEFPEGSHFVFLVSHQFNQVITEPQSRTQEEGGSRLAWKYYGAVAAILFAGCLSINSPTSRALINIR